RGRSVAYRQGAVDHLVVFAHDAGYRDARRNDITRPVARSTTHTAPPRIDGSPNQSSQTTQPASNSTRCQPRPSPAPAGPTAPAAMRSACSWVIITHDLSVCGEVNGVRTRHLALIKAQSVFRGRPLFKLGPGPAPGAGPLRHPQDPGHPPAAGQTGH